MDLVSLITENGERRLVCPSGVGVGVELFACSPPLSHVITSPSACAQCGAFPRYADQHTGDKGDLCKQEPPHTPLPFCQGCHFLRYCSPECQRRDWRAHHKAECPSLKAAARAGVRSLPPAVRLVARLLRVRPGHCNPCSDGPLRDGERRKELETNPLHLASNYAVHTQRDLAVYAHVCPLLLLLLGGGEGSAGGGSLGGGGGSLPSGGAARPPFSPRDILEMCARVRCSAFTLHDMELMPMGIGCYGVGGAANHSCAPTAVAHFHSPERGAPISQTLRSLVPLHPGAEVTLAYCDVGAPTPLRRAELREGYYFSCACSRCAAVARVEGQLLLHTAQAEGLQQELTLIPQVAPPPTALAGGGALAAGAPPQGATPAPSPPPSPAWRYLEAYSSEDLSMLCLPCHAPSCAGQILCIPHFDALHAHASAAAALFRGKQQQQQQQQAGGASSSSEGHGDEGGGAGRQGVEGHPPHEEQLSHLFALPCTACASHIEPGRASALQSLYSAVGQLKVARDGTHSSGEEFSALSARFPGGHGHSAGRARLQQCLSCLAAARALALPPKHYLLFTAAAAATHAAVNAGEMQCALEAAQAALAGLCNAHPPGHPIPILFHATLGKLHHYLDNPQLAAHHFDAALGGLQRTYGKGHELYVELHERLQDARMEMEASAPRG